MIVLGRFSAIAILPRRLLQMQLQYIVSELSAVLFSHYSCCAQKRIVLFVYGLVSYALISPSWNVYWYASTTHKDMKAI